MIVTPNYSNIGQVFSTENIFCIPKYQRPYSWEEEHIKDFFNDLSYCYKTKSDHFLGAIVTISAKIEGTNKSRYEVIDGQQRLTTLVLFAFALLKHYQDIKCKLESLPNYVTEDLYETLNLSIKELSEQYIRLKFAVNGKINEEFKLNPSNSDSDYYTSFLLNIDINPNSKSNEKMKYAYYLLYKCIDDLINYNQLNETTITIDLLNEKFTLLNNIINILNDKIFLLNVVTQNKSDAYKLFQTLNNRGLNLNVADLLKAKTLEMLDKFPSYQEIAENLWIKMADSSSIVDFLSCAYFYEKGCNPNKNDLFDTLLNQFFNYSISQENDAKLLCNKIQKLYKLFNTYNKITSGKWPYPDTEDSNTTDWQKYRLHILIKKLKHTQCIPLLLHASNKQEHEFFEFLQLTERFFFRSKIIFSLHAGKLTKLYSTVCKDFFTKPTYTLQSYKNELKHFTIKEMPDEKFTENIDMNLHYKPYGGNADLKYLYSIINDYNDCCDKALKNPKQFISLDTDCYQILDFDKISIEHISAQNGLDDFNSKYTHKLGNLTLLSKKLNTQLANSNYQIKKSHLINTQLKINSDFKNIQDWNEESFESRHNKIIKSAQYIFDLNK